VANRRKLDLAFGALALLATLVSLVVSILSASRREGRLHAGNYSDIEGPLGRVVATMRG
jgi:hypothetical protein